MNIMNNPLPGNNVQQCFGVFEAIHWTVAYCLQFRWKLTAGTSFLLFLKGLVKMSVIGVDFQ